MSDMAHAEYVVANVVFEVRELFKADYTPVPLWAERWLISRDRGAEDAARAASLACSLGCAGMAAMTAADAARLLAVGDVDRAMQHARRVLVWSEGARGALRDIERGRA